MTAASACIVIWHDLAPGFEEDFESWHTEEHMPERLAVPGFLRGTRYMNWAQSPHVCFTLYELAHIEMFRSPAYLARLNAPTEWSKRVQPGMTNFLRGPCESVLSLGGGTAGAIATARIRMAQPRSADAQGRLCDVAARLFERSGITSARLARHELAWSGLSTSETRLRPFASQSLFDYVLMVEAISRKTLARESSSVEELLLAAGSTSVELGCYDLQFQLCR